MSFESIDFRKTLSQFATGVAVLLTAEGEDKGQGITINSLTSVSLNPPLILFCLKSTLARAQIFQDCSLFTLNILSLEQQFVADYFARKDASLQSVEIEINPDGRPLIPGSMAHLYCQRQAIYPGGDHNIYVCQVLGLAWDDTKSPLIFHRSRYGTIAS